MRKKGISRLLAMTIAFSMVIGGNFQGAVAGNVSYGAEFSDGGEVTDGAADPAVLTEEQSKDEPEEVILPEESTGESTDESTGEEDGNNENPAGDEPQFQDVTESQNQDVDEADDNASDSASEDMEIEDVEEENAETDLLEGEELQPVNDSTKIIEDPANPACGMIVDYSLDGSLLEAYSRIHFSCNEGKVDDIWYKEGSYDGYWYRFLYGKIDNRYEYITMNRAYSFDVISEAKSYVGKYSSIRMVVLPRYYYWDSYKRKYYYLTDSILAQNSSSWVDKATFKLQGEQIKTCEIQQVSDAGGKGCSLPDTDQWTTYEGDGEHPMEQLTTENPRSVIRIRNAVSKQVLEYQENGLPKGAVVIRNAGEIGTVVSVTGHLTGKTKYIVHEDTVEECESDNYRYKIGAEKYSQNEEGKWENTDYGQKWYNLYGSETRRYLSPGECLVLYPMVSEMYHYQLLVEFNRDLDTTTKSVEAVQGEWTQKGQYWSTEVSSDVTDITNPQLNVTSKEAAVPSFKENGLPNYALLIHGNAQTEAVTGYAGESRYPGYFVRVNPCWDKLHNSQPENYQTPGLWAACIYYKWNQNTRKYEVNDEDRDNTGWNGIQNIENYEDTSDYYHCFYVNPKPDEVAAIIPLRCKGDQYSYEHTPEEYENTQSRNYCFQYQVFLNSTQEWSIIGVNALDGQSSPTLVDGMVKGAWLTCGNGTAEHEGTVGADLEISTQLQKDGKLYELGKNGLPNIGFQMKIGEIPADGLTGMLKVNITVPEDFKNGEAGMGYSSDDQYREPAGGSYWTYKITGKGGTRMAAVLFRNQGDGTYIVVDAQNTTVTAEDGGSLNLAEMDLQTGDILCIIPYSPEYTGFTRKEYYGKYESTLKSNDPDNNKVFPDTLYGSTQNIRYFNFDYSLSLDGTGDILSVIGENETEIENEADVFYGKESVCDDGKYLQEAVLSVSTGEKLQGCGLLENGLPNYGFIFLPGEFGSIYIDPALNNGEKYSWYVLEKYQLNDDGKYTIVSGNYGPKVVIYRIPKGKNAIDVESNSTVIQVFRPIFPNKKVTSSMRNDNYIDQSWWNNYRKDGAYETTDKNGNVIYPQTGTVSYACLINEISRDDETRLYTYLKKTNRWHTTDWQNTSPEAVCTPNVSYGVTGEVNYTSEKERLVVLQGLGTNTVSLSKQTLPENSLPENGLVIQNKNIGGSSNELAEFNIQLNMAEDGVGGDEEYGVMYFNAWLYRQDKEGNWHKIEKKNETGDWINILDSGTFESGTYQDAGRLHGEFGYMVHAHLKDNEAIVIVPQYDLYTFSYRVWLSNAREYDVVHGSCQIPSDVQHPGRHEFTGTLSHFPTEDPKTEHLVIATSPKNVDAGGSETVSRLTNVRSLPVTLFNYDFGEWAHFVLGAQTAQYRFRYDPKNVKNTAVNSWYNNIFTGILKNQLGEDGLPVFNYTTPFSLFDTSVVPAAVNGGTKSVYQNVGFDFVYDPSANEYSYQSSINHAGYDPGANKIYQYDKAIGIEGWDEKGAGFFPFNSFEDKGVWGTSEKNTKGIYLLDQLKTVDYHFGMSMEKDFIIPEEGTVAITDDQGNVSARKDMVFSFSGDDDAWLFVDGQLVLDMGGIHEAVSGSINFTKGTFTVTSSVTGDTRTQSLSSVFADYPEAIGKWDDSAWAAGTKHTFSFFYLERGGTLSDCSIKFNLPVFKDFAVTKAVEGKDTQESFDFEMELLDGQGNAYTGNLYQLTDGKRTPVENGTGKYQFQLKAGEPIQFSTLQECTAYRVTETKQGNWIAGWASTNGKSGEGNMTELLPTDCDVTVTNRYQESPPTEPTITPTNTPTPQVTTTPAPEVSATPIPSVTVSKTPTPTKKPKPSDTPEPTVTVTVTEGPSGGSGNGGAGGSGNGGSGYSTNSPKTGDDSDAALWQTLLLLAMGAILVTTMRIVRKQKEL
ncbi:DUF7601 domain-containing protein [Blautia glucerasea]|uniref:DUF7601 domain-containing protein n=1 Tax=Blautia glucerasea TaxID=536633 RepID=UPI00156FB2F0|nr:hypothetical protein [Blautia glucerasea]NSJ27590.1 hypothetical protein [Blautia glucerasea]